VLKSRTGDRDVPIRSVGLRPDTLTTVKTLSNLTKRVKTQTSISKRNAETKAITNMTEKDLGEDKTMQEPLIPAKDVQPAVPPPLASRNQIRGAMWAGGISGLLFGGPIGAIALAWVASHLASKNVGDPGDFCRRTGDFMNRMGSTIRHEWEQSRSSNSDEAPQIDAQPPH
jgi:hypothetical protein